MNTNLLLAEMDKLLSLSESKVRMLGDLVLNAHQSNTGITEKIAEEAAAIKSEIRSLTKSWQQKYDMLYCQNY